MYNKRVRIDLLVNIIHNNAPKTREEKKLFFHHLLYICRERGGITIKNNNQSNKM